MTSGLRRVHKYIWLLLIIIVPVIMVFSIKNLEFLVSKNNTTSSFNSLKKGSINRSENEIIKGTVFENYVEIILKSTLKNSSSVVYEMDEKGHKINVIGQLTTAGIYNFNINNLPKGIIIYDAIKHVEITKISFKWD